jgi:hypothetical protein
MKQILCHCSLHMRTSSQRSYHFCFYNIFRAVISTAVSFPWPIGHFSQRCALVLTLGSLPKSDFAWTGNCKARVLDDNTVYFTYTILHLLCFVKIILIYIRSISFEVDFITHINRSISSPLKETVSKIPWIKSIQKAVKQDGIVEIFYTCQSCSHCEIVQNK